MNDVDTQFRPVAIVTGASSGIGKAFAEKLAKGGYDLVLVARDHERLSALATLLRSRWEVNVEVHCADLSNEDDVRGLERKIHRTRNLRMLINNAGFLTKGFFIESDVEEQAAMVRLHDLAPLRLTYAALQVMSRSSTQTTVIYPTSVINVSSVAGYGTSVGNITYSATKAFLTNFTVGLAAELHDTGIHVQAFCPGYTKTEIHERAGLKRGMKRGWWCTPRDVVEASLEGLVLGKTVVIPGFRYRCIVFASRFIPLTLHARLKRFAERFLRSKDSID